MIPELKNNFDLLKRATFVSITYISNNGEIAKHIINCNISYDNAIKRDILFLKSLDVNTIKTDINIDLLFQAKNELLSSLIERNNNYNEGIIENKNYIKINNSIKYNIEKEYLYIYGLTINKIILKNSDEITKVKNSKPLTIAKDLIRSLLRTSKYRIFNIELNKMDIVKFNKKEFRF